VWRSPALTEAKLKVVTVTVAVPLTPSLVAVTRAVPTPRDATWPFASTVATAGLSLAQVMGRFTMAEPSASWGVADRPLVSPTMSVAAAGLTLTDAIDRRGPTVTGVVCLTAPLVAVIVASPAVTPVTVASIAPKGTDATVATDGALLVQITGASSTNPDASRTVATKTMVSSAATLTGEGETATDAGIPRTNRAARAVSWPTLAVTM
jgi:hypothetical protein